MDKEQVTAKLHTYDEAAQAEQLSSVAKSTGVRRHYEVTAARWYLEAGDLHDAKRLASKTVSDVGEKDPSYYGYMARVVLIRIEKMYQVMGLEESTK